MKQFKVLVVAERSLEWVLHKSEKFPKAYRFTLTQRISEVHLALYESLLLAQEMRGEMRSDELKQASRSLHLLVNYLRLAFEWRFLNSGQYHHISK